MTDAHDGIDGALIHPCPASASCGYCNDTVPPEERPDWSFLDAVYCISLKSRDDRAQLAAAEFHRVGLCQQAMFYRPEKHPDKGIAGSWESHRAVARMAREHNFRTTLVCEDDVLFVGRITPARVRAIGVELGRLPRDWTIFHLGHWPLAAYFVRARVLRTASACAHAYIASERLTRWLAERPYGTEVPMNRRVGKALDAAFARLPGVYALYPMIAIQRVSASDNFKTTSRPKKKLKHYVTRSKHREWLLSNLMRPAEKLAVVLSPLWWFRAKLAERSRPDPAS